MCKYFYHYTDRNGAEGIRMAQRIKRSASDVKDTVYGYGVYLTDLPPSRGKSVISYNIGVKNITHVVVVGLEASLWVTEKSAQYHI